MANNNRREIELALSITTANADALAKLQQDVRDLAKEGGDAAPAFQKLADELGQLAEQAKQLTALEGLTQELKAAATAQVDAASKSTALKQTLDQLVAATDAAREAERAKNLELSNAKRAVQEAQDAISKLKNDTSEAGKNTAGYTIKLVELKGALLDARAAKRDLTAQLDALKVKTQDAASAVKDQGKAYKDAAKDTTDATTAMRGLQAQVDGVTEKYRTAGGAADDLANAQSNLGTAAAGVRAAIQGVIADQDRLAQAERDVSYAVFSAGPWPEIAAYREFMGWAGPWYSTQDTGTALPATRDGGDLRCYLRDGDDVFQTYETTARGVEAMLPTLQLLDLTAYGRQEAWEDSPAGWPQGEAGAWWWRDGRPVAQGVRRPATR